MYVLQKETGWTDDYILWGTSWVNLQMKLADAPNFNRNKKNKTGTIQNERELKIFLEQSE